MTVIEKIFFFKLIDPKRKGHVTPQGAIQGHTKVRQEAEGEEENLDRSLYCGFHRKEWVTWVSRLIIG